MMRAAARPALQQQYGGGYQPLLPLAATGVPQRPNASCARALFIVACVVGFARRQHPVRSTDCGMGAALSNGAFDPSRNRTRRRSAEEHRRRHPAIARPPPRWPAPAARRSPRGRPRAIFPPSGSGTTAATASSTMVCGRTECSAVAAARTSSTAPNAPRPRASALSRTASSDRRTPGLRQGGAAPGGIVRPSDSDMRGRCRTATNVSRTISRPRGPFLVRNLVN
jgi:hypothetical protein